LWYFVTGSIGPIESCVPALRRYAGTLLRDRQEVDDLVQDCLVRALDRMHTRRSDAEMRPWLFSILHKLYVSRVRQKRTHGWVESLDDIAESVIALETPQDDVIRTKDVLRAVQRLPEDLRSVLLLVTVEDLTYADVARVLDIPIGTVMSRLFRARERVRREA
jgi:RNA polymerase sigma factor (sigma-70 family)